MTSTGIFRPNTPAVVNEFFDNEVILVNMTRGHYYSLRDAAATLWQGICAGLAVPELAGLLTDTFTVSQQEAETDVATFLNTAQEQGLLVATDQPVVLCPLPPAGAKRPYHSPQLEVYTDMEDLLGLDPIHDVDPQQGWPVAK